MEEGRTVSSQGAENMLEGAGRGASFHIDQHGQLGCYVEAGTVELLEQCVILQIAVLGL
jgi:hypothetical protein